MNELREPPDYVVLSTVNWRFFNWLVYWILANKYRVTWNGEG